MKKIVLVSLAFLFVLVGCGQKKETGPATKTEKDTLQSALPVIENAEKNTVVTMTFPSQMMVASKPKPLLTKTRLF